MSRLYLFISLFFILSTSYGQKPAIDESAIMHWPHLDYLQKDCHINDDGKFISYFVATNVEGSILHLSSVDGKYQRKFNVGEYNSGDFNRFIGDKWFVSLIKGDSLCIINLATKKEQFIAGVDSYETPQDGKISRLVYHTKDNELIVTDITTGQQKLFENILNYLVNKHGNRLVLEHRNGTNEQLEWVNANTGQEKSIWSGKSYSRCTFNQQQDGIAFVARGGTPNGPGNLIYLYKDGEEVAHVLISNNMGGIDKGFQVADAELKFNCSDTKLFFRIQAIQKKANIDPLKADVDIWNYSDNYVPFDNNNPQNYSYLTVIKFSSGKISCLENEDNPSFEILNNGGDDNYLLLGSKCNIYEWSWQERDRKDIYLVNTDNGSKTCIYRHLAFGEPQFSPSGHYVVWYDRLPEKGFSYNLQTMHINDITSILKMSIDRNLIDNPLDNCQWLPNDVGLLGHDKYDIWKIRLDGQIPVNLTNGYGFAHKVLFAIPDINRTQSASSIDSKTVILSAFDDNNKQNGFYKINVYGEVKNPEKLVMSDDCYYMCFSFGEMIASAPILLLKAANVSCFVLCKLNSQQQNLVVTSDFQKFKTVTDLHPEKDVNWLVPELIDYPSFDGRPGTGVLYKPENFDPRKKYPLIVYVYEKLAELKNGYPMPRLSNGNINVPWMVSRGYLVFCPNIDYRAGKLGEDNFNFVVSGINILKEKAWVDSAHIGYQGHSFGAVQGAILLTKTNEFAAALLASGSGDIIDFYLASGEGFGSDFTEGPQIRMGESLWENKQAYLDNDAVLNADKVTTPTLLLADNNDFPKLYWGTDEFFTALRRLGKPCWLLNYENEGHSVDDPINQLDYTHRVEQFFDHYLKGAPTPKWMVKGVPIWEKQIDDGFELEPSNIEPRALHILSSQKGLMIP